MLESLEAYLADMFPNKTSQVRLHQKNPSTQLIIQSGWIKVAFACSVPAKVVEILQLSSTDTLFILLVNHHRYRLIDTFNRMPDSREFSTKRDNLKVLLPVKFFSK